MKKLVYFMIVLFSISLYAKDEPIYQVSTLNALLAGNYDGLIKVEDFLKRGSVGLGTFNELDGEMIVLDGKCFRAKAIGEVVEVKKNETIPFGVITNFELEKQHHIEYMMNLKDLKDFINPLFINKDVFYVIKVLADFKYIKYRSVPKQERPYKNLSLVIKNEQVIFEEQNIAGTIIGFYFPEFMKGLNVVGYHFHFLSDDLTKGGHVFDFKADNLLVILDQKRQFVLDLADGSFMGGLKIDSSSQ
ncbi:MAG: acetolactate decarboxylase [bacterium]|nr:acetolactate decarboxylase [bacterium]